MDSPITPYQHSSAGKKEQVASMFNRIAVRYDFLNHFLSLGIDKIWRRKAISEFTETMPVTLLDLATGTGDLGFDALKRSNIKVVGIDISANMLELADKKIKIAGLEHRFSVELGDSENLTFADNSFDGVMAAFGVRNFENLEKGLSEMYRVLKPGSKAVILEFSQPTLFPFRQIYLIYFKYILPFLGSKVSRDREAYSYLHRSVINFPDGKLFVSLLETAGFTHTKHTPLSLGICTIYTGLK